MNLAKLQCIENVNRKRSQPIRLVCLDSYRKLWLWSWHRDKKKEKKNEEWPENMFPVAFVVWHKWEFQLNIARCQQINAIAQVYKKNAISKCQRLKV